LSSLSIESNYNKKDRKINFVGHAYFDVRRDSLKPFIIQNTTTQIQVLGTTFSVDAYPTKEYVEVDVLSGKVSFLEKVGMKRVLLTRGMRGIFRIMDKALVTTSPNDSDIRFIGKLQFDDASLGEILVQLKASFGKEFMLANREAASCRFTGSFDSPTLDEVLEVLSASLNIHASPEGNGYRIAGEGCH
jgi:transmembrane sensor